MKKAPKDTIIKLLKNKGTRTYQEIATLTGYHPKSLIRLNSHLKLANYNVDSPRTNMQNKIIEDYLKSNYQSYKDFYNYGLKEKISYSSLCKILQKVKLNKEIVFIKKIKIKNNYHFIVTDYQTHSLLFSFNSLKNDKNSFKKLYFIILTKYGTPNYISFINFFKSIPPEIQNLLNKYNTNVLPYKSIYRNFNNLLKVSKNIKYEKIAINKEDFYNSIQRTTIANNVIQFANTRWIINNNSIIKKNIKVVLFYNDEKDDMFIKYKNITYKLIAFKKLKSKKGISKYS